MWDGSTPVVVVISQLRSNRARDVICHLRLRQNCCHLDAQELGYSALPALEAKNCGAISDRYL